MQRKTNKTRTIVKTFSDKISLFQVYVQGATLPPWYKFLIKVF